MHSFFRLFYFFTLSFPVIRYNLITPFRWVNKKKNQTFFIFLCNFMCIFTDFAKIWQFQRCSPTLIWAWNISGKGFLWKKPPTFFNFLCLARLWTMIGIYWCKCEKIITILKTANSQFLDSPWDCYFLGVAILNMCLIELSLIIFPPKIDQITWIDPNYWFLT